MDFVERWSGISADGGSGILEVSMILGVLIVLCILVFPSTLQAGWSRRASKVAGHE